MCARRLDRGRRHAGSNTYRPTQTWRKQVDYLQRRGLLVTHVGKLNSPKKAWRGTLRSSRRESVSKRWVESLLLLFALIGLKVIDELEGKRHRQVIADKQITRQVPFNCLSS